MTYGANRPGIIVLSHLNEDSFRWISDGWFNHSRRRSYRAQQLMRKARTAIEGAANVTHAMMRLKVAGFEVTHKPESEEQ